MATISERKRANGSIAHFAQIRVYRHGRVAHTESRTFERRSDAKAWAIRRESELAKVGSDFSHLKQRGKTLGDAIDRYIAESHKEIGRTKAQVLRSIKSYEIADLPCQSITSVEIVSFAQELLPERSPATVGNYISHLASIFAIAEPAWGMPLAADQMKAAQAVCTRLGLTGKAASRDRRPSIEEIDALMDHFGRIIAARPSSIPMQQIVIFALFSTRRQDEIMRLRWDDLDVGGSRVLVRDMKHPGDKLGNDIWCDLPSPALVVVRSMPKTDERIFPFNSSSVGAAFTRATRSLGLVDLKFHDLRHEGVSRLFETGLTIPQAASVSGHRSWQSLQRYSHLRQTGDKWEDWRWIKVLN